MKLKTCYLVLETDRPVTKDATHLRGYVAGMYPDRPILHHHAPALLYTYPRVQYRVVEGTPAVLGIEEGAETLREIGGSIAELSLGNETYQVTRRVAYEQEVGLHPTRGMWHYRFVTPWLALNEKNYERYQKAETWPEKKDLINRILVGNVLSMAKGLGCVVDQRLRAATHLEQVPVTYKGIGMTGFVGEFRVNFAIPEYFGLGKGVSRGFGAVKPIPPLKKGSGAPKEGGKEPFPIWSEDR
ncbi:hypothetical protein E2N92_01515 [Methanofollis formosanus]|uniref:DNA repair protein n=1 Tax=Methanofollis formosanus TaxID=299308 RepID=A0A8G0ZZ02_9EURY|nr:CRISPR-associated endonuclease Cas6 [Methanofollis formosanus]QYZ78200.1 hypothetical protein E2N92_01515 [Methanofollis formosanus]